MHVRACGWNEGRKEGRKEGWMEVYPYACKYVWTHLCAYDLTCTYKARSLSLSLYIYTHIHAMNIKNIYMYISPRQKETIHASRNMPAQMHKAETSVQ